MGHDASCVREDRLRCVETSHILHGDENVYTVRLPFKKAPCCLCWTMMKREAVASADNSRRGSPNYSLACSMGEIEDWRNSYRERPSTPHNQSHRRHVARTGNDQTVAAASEHMPRVSPNIHLSRQTAPAAVGRRRNCWYIYTSLNCALRNDPLTMS